MKHLKKKYWLAVKVLIVVIVLVAVKFAMHIYGYEYIELTSLFSAVVGGAIFLIGFILAGTMADYKESEKIPSEISSSLENILQEGIFAKSTKPKFDLESHKKRLLEIVVSFRDDLKTVGRRKKTIDSVAKLTDSTIEMDNLGISPNYVSRIKTEQANITKHVLRAFQIKETSFIPAAYAIVEVMSAFMIIGLMLLKLEPFITSLILLSIVVYIFLYMIFFIKDLDDPFEQGGYADVDMFLIDNFENKVKTL
ncbi:MAG: hypothetical protein HY831_05285 [Candidatus Aenigmarchaeota archaeon]|nr:hypothetical protein [Candidatus Aenigmarchaeota archaeon]